MPHQLLYHWVGQGVWKIIQNTWNVHNSVSGAGVDRLFILALLCRAIQELLNAFHFITNGKTEKNLYFFPGRVKHVNNTMRYFTGEHLPRFCIISEADVPGIWARPPTGLRTKFLDPGREGPIDLYWMTRGSTGSCGVRFDVQQGGAN